MEEKFPYKIGQPVEIFFNRKWRRGKIVAGHRYQDGIVTIETESGERLWCGEAKKDLYRPYCTNSIPNESSLAKIHTIADFYGYAKQSRQCTEECAELIQALCKRERKWGDCSLSESADSPERTAIIGELADVLITAKQIEYLLSAEDEVMAQIDFKLDRQLARIEVEKGC